jgi:hypothetical protein
VLEVADIFRQHAAAYQVSHSLLPSQSRVLRDIQYCRTAYFGGELTQCDHCGQYHYAYHSCKNRHCPKCNGEHTALWLDHQREALLPCPYYLLTFTLPAALRNLVFAHQRLLYGALLRCAAASVLKLTADPRYVGATPTVLALLHTWTRAMLFHPHAHLLVSAGGFSQATQRWLVPKNPAFLVPVRALSVIFRAKIRDVFQQAKLLDQVPQTVWTQPWVVHCQHAGSGQKVLDYLGRYLFRVAISNSRLKAFDNAQVTFGYRDNRTQQPRQVTLPAQQFIDRFLKHVLPQRFPKVRYYGLASATRHDAYEQARALLTAPPAATADSPPLDAQAPPPKAHSPLPLCPACRLGHLVFIQSILPQRKFPP